MMYILNDVCAKLNQTFVKMNTSFDQPLGQL